MHLDRLPVGPIQRESGDPDVRTLDDVARAAAEREAARDLVTLTGLVREALWHAYPRACVTDEDERIYIKVAR